eukprot:317992_1
MGFQICLEYTPELGFYLFLVVAGALAVYVCVCYGIKNTRQLPLGNRLKILYYTNCFLFAWGATGYMLFELIPFSSYFCQFDGILIPVGVLIGYAGYWLGLLSLYAMLVERLRLSFSGSSLALSNTLYYFLLSGIFIEFIPIFFGGLLYWVHIDESQMDGQWLGAATEVAIVFVDSFYGILLLIIFVRKTYLLAQKTINVTNTKDFSSTRSNSVSSNIQTSEDLIYLQNLFQPAVKYTICACLAVLSSIFANYLAFHRVVVVEQDTIELLWLHVSLDQIDIFINVLCILLQFPYSRTCYYILCNPCRRGISYIVFKKWLNKQQPNTIKTQPNTVKQTKDHSIKSEQSDNVAGIKALSIETVKQSSENINVTNDKNKNEELSS